MSATLIEFLDALDLFAGYAKDRAVGPVFLMVDMPIREIISRIDWLASAAEFLTGGQELSEEFLREHRYIRRQPTGGIVHLVTVQTALRELEKQVLEAQLAGIMAVTAERENKQ